jgi:hypothetical protein
MVFDNMKEYIDSIKDISWINDADYIVKKSDDITYYGYPHFLKENFRNIFIGKAKETGKLNPEDLGRL